MQLRYIMLLLFTPFLMATDSHQNGHKKEALSDSLDHPAKFSAYGGQSLLNVASITIETDRRLAWPGQSQTAGFVEFGTDRMIKHFDFAVVVGSVERWTHQNGNFYHNRYLADKKGETVIDYAAQTYTENKASSFDRAFVGDTRSSDVLLARAIIANPESVKSVSDGFYVGHKTKILEVELLPETPLLQVYVSLVDGLIRRVKMVRAFGDVNIIFGSHRLVDGIMRATESWFFIDGNLVEYEPNIRLFINRKHDTLLQVDKGLLHQPEMVDLSQMTVDEIGTNRYLVGQGDYSQFIEHNGAYIVVNAYSGLQDRYRALNEFRGRTIPISHIIVTHHHTDHMESISAAAELGAKLVMSAETVNEFSKPIYKPVNDKPVDMISNDTQLGPLTLYVVPTSHSVENIFVFDRVTGHLFQDDHYHGLLKHGPSRVQPTAYELREFIIDRALPVTGLLSGHARKVEQWEVFNTAVDEIGRPSICPMKRPICLDGFGR